MVCPFNFYRGWNRENQNYPELHNVHTLHCKSLIYTETEDFYATTFSRILNLHNICEN